MYYVATVIKPKWHSWRNGHIAQWSRMENSEINPHKYIPRIFDRGGKVI